MWTVRISLSTLKHSRIWKQISTPHQQTSQQLGQRLTSMTSRVSASPTTQLSSARKIPLSSLQQRNSLTSSSRPSRSPRTTVHRKTVRFLWWRSLSTDASCTSRWHHSADFRMEASCRTSGWLTKSTTNFLRAISSTSHRGSSARHSRSLNLSRRRRPSSSRANFSEMLKATQSSTIANFQFGNGLTNPFLDPKASREKSWDALFFLKKPLQLRQHLFSIKTTPICSVVEK